MNTPRPARRHSCAPLFALAPLALAIAAAHGQPLPTGGQISAGQGRITTNGSAMTVTQGSQRLIADWRSFSIGTGNTVRFVQPSSRSIALNRVTGDDTSTILGRLDANGHVYLTNPNGVLFGRGAEVNVGSLVATTLDVDADRFLTGGSLRLSGAEADDGVVHNAGRITAARGGHVVLAGREVTNTGTIAAPLGTAALAAGAAVEVDATGAGLLTVRVPVAAVQARLANRGTIAADGGTVLLHAAAADAARATVMNVGGVVRARTVEEREGRIVLSGGDGRVQVGGVLDARGGVGAEGGDVKVLGDRVALVGAARIDASGGARGGEVLVGGAFQGKGPEPNARATYVGENVAIDASARDFGDGGAVIVWADGGTRFDGRIAARGGARGGDGGSVEVSGKGMLDFNGTVDARAPRGKQGELLLDPDNLVVGTIADIDGNSSPIGDDLTAATNPLEFADFAGVTSQITATAVAGLLFTTDVTLQAVDSMAIVAPISVAAGGTATTLTLNAASITLNGQAPMTLNNAALVADTQVTGRGTGISVFDNISSNRSITLRSGAIGLAGNLSAPTVTLSMLAGVAGTITQAAGAITANVLNVDRSGGAAATTVDLSSATNQIVTLAIDAGTASVTDGVGGIAVSGRVSGAFALDSAGGAIAQAGSLSVGGTTSLNASGSIGLGNAANAFGGTVSFDAGGTVAITAAGNLAATGDAAGAINLVAGGIFTLPASLVSNNGDIDIRSAGFVNSTGGVPSVTAGNRFAIRSTDFNVDNLGIGFGGGAAQINHIALNSGAGATLPAGANLYVTNRTGTITAPNADAPDISRVYDRTTLFDWLQTGTSGTARWQVAGGGTAVLGALGAYTIDSTGNFADRNAGTDKGYTVASSTDVQGTLASGATVSGLRFAGLTRAAGPLVPGAPGGVISVVTRRPITLDGLDGVDRDYDGTTVVGLDGSAATLSGTIAGDAVALDLSGASGSMADKNVGTDKAVTVSGVALSGADAANYTLVDSSTPTATIAQLVLTPSGIRASNKVFDGNTNIVVDASGAQVGGVVAGDDVVLDASGATGSVETPDAGRGKAVFIAGLVLTGADAANYAIAPNPVNADGSVLAVRVLTPAQAAFEEIRFGAYLQGVSDAQEPFRRAMAEALAAGFGRENIRKQLTRGLVFETGLAPPAVDTIDSARRPAGCTATGAGLVCATR